MTRYPASVKVAIKFKGQLRASLAAPITNTTVPFTDSFGGMSSYQTFQLCELAKPAFPFTSSGIGLRMTSLIVSLFSFDTLGTGAQVYILLPTQRVNDTMPKRLRRFCRFFILSLRAGVKIAFPRYRGLC